jgi:hypothetical protein
MQLLHSIMQFQFQLAKHSVCSFVVPAVALLILQVREHFLEESVWFAVSQFSQLHLDFAVVRPLRWTTKPCPVKT